MAIGDAIDVLLAASGGTYQPASGVEVVITALIKPGSTDALNITNGSVARGWFQAAFQPDQGKIISACVDPYNMHCVLTNSLHAAKAGTTDSMYLMGVTTNV